MHETCTCIMHDKYNHQALNVFCIILNLYHTVCDYIGIPRMQFWQIIDTFDCFVRCHTNAGVGVGASKWIKLIVGHEEARIYSLI